MSGGSSQFIVPEALAKLVADVEIVSKETQVKGFSGFVSVSSGLVL